MTPPPLGLLIGAPPPPTLRELLVALHAWCRPVTADPHRVEPAARAYLCYAADRLPPARQPYAAWVGAPDEPDPGLVEDADVLLCDDPAVAARLDHRVVYVADERRLAGTAYLGPYVRRRLRRLRGLPEVVVAEAGEAGWRWPGWSEPLPTHLVGTAAGCCAAVIARGPALLTALAWGAPTVTDAESATAVGALDDVHVVQVADSAAARGCAEELARNDRTAARLGWAGRQLVEARHDIDRAAARVARLLRLWDLDVELADVVARARLDELGTPPDATVIARTRRAMRGLAEPGMEGAEADEPA